LAVPIFIGQLETQSILIGMGKVDVPRPLTHDLAISLIHTFGAEISKIEINDLREGTFFARMVLKAGERDMVVDSRPSDAIGIAVRVDCPVFIAESVVEEAGISVNLVTGEQTSGEASDKGSAPPLVLQPGDELVRLKTELEEAISEEDYERAAILRDRIRELEGGL
ncbi:MAG TPA: bifunctional nuclease family protein, partial [Rectinemataceae bacterium]|nr:bifunctional nuclease family protein [Rectinemataceae bacterium]